MTAILNRKEVGAVQVFPGSVSLQTTDSYATITTAGYLSQNITGGFSLYTNDIIYACYGTDSATVGLFGVSFDNNNIPTLAPAINTDVALPTIANHIATYTNTSGGLGEDATTAINGGNLQAGLSGTAGTLASFPATASKGSFKVIAVANTGNTVTTLSNVAMGQASVISIPDPVSATATLAEFATVPATTKNLIVASGTAGLVADAGAKIISGTSPSYAGGGTSNAFSITGLSSASVGSAVIRTSTNAVAIAKAVPGSNILTVTFSADPGASTTVDYIYTTAALTP